MKKKQKKNHLEQEKKIKKILDREIKVQEIKKNLKKKSKNKVSFQS